MRIHLYTLCLLLLAAAAQAQQPAATLPDAPSWTRAEAVKPNANIHVFAKTGSVSCHFKSADDVSLICAAGDGAKVLAFQRADVRRITLPRRGWSALIGLGIGVGVGAILGAAAGESCTPQSFFCFSRGSLAALAAIPLGVIGAGVGALTDFDRKTIYRAP
jgi:hypothetical protein